MKPSVALVSNIFHYTYTARALARADYLRTFITSWSLLEGERAPRWLPGKYRRKLEGRQHIGLNDANVQRLYYPEAIEQALLRMPFVPSVWQGNVSADILGRTARHRLERIDDWNVLHFVNTIGRQCVELAKERDALVVCDSRQEHPAFQREAVEREAAKWGVPLPPGHGAFDKRMEYELSLSDQLIVPSAFARRTFVERGFPADRIHVIPYGANLQRFHPVPKEPSSKLRLLFVGTLGLRKGILNLLEALRRMNNKAIELTCIGRVEGNIKPLLAKYADLFTYYGTVPNIDLPGFYSRADLFVLPSIADAYPLAILESLACGTPVLTTPNVGSADLIKEGMNGFIVSAGDADAIASKFEDALSLKAMLTALHTAHTLSMCQLAWSTYENNIGAFYLGTGASLKPARASVL